MGKAFLFTIFIIDATHTLNASHWLFREKTLSNENKSDYGSTAITCMMFFDGKSDSNFFQS